MKLAMRSSMPCVVVARDVREYESNGRKGISHTLGLVCDGQVANLPCTQQAYDKVGELGQYSEVYVYGDYDTNYKNFKIVMVEPVAKK